MREGIEITGEKDGQLIFVQGDGSGCGRIPVGSFESDRLSHAPDGGFFTEVSDGSGCGRRYSDDLIAAHASIRAYFKWLDETGVPSSKRQ